MTLSFKISGRIAAPVAQVFEAVADPALLSRYFTTGGARGRLETGATVMWDFADFPGAFPVEVVEAIPNRRIVLKWQAHEGPPPEGTETSADAAADYQTVVTMDFAPTDDGRTLITIAESGWRDSARGLQGSYGNCQGWSQMMCCLKAWIEHGINLRDGFYR